VIFVDVVGERPLEEPFECGGDCEAFVLPKRMSSPRMRLDVCLDEDPPRGLEAEGSAASRSDPESSSSGDRGRLVARTRGSMVDVFGRSVRAELARAVVDVLVVCGAYGWSVAIGDDVVCCVLPARSAGFWWCGSALLAL
jgi:hypothetical protein